MFNPNQAGADLRREASLELSGPAALVVEVPYSLTAEGQQFISGTQSLAVVRGSISFLSTNGTSEDASRSFQIDSFFDGPGTKSGIMLFGIVTDSGGVANILFGATASSQSTSVAQAVPEPSILASLLGGLLMLGLWGRRRMID